MAKFRADCLSRVRKSGLRLIKIDLQLFQRFPTKLDKHCCDDFLDVLAILLRTVLEQPINYGWREILEIPAAPERLQNVVHFTFQLALDRVKILLTRSASVPRILAAC